MATERSASSPIEAGDVAGLGRVYSASGSPILGPGEKVIAQRGNCDLAVFGSWRVFFSKEVFHPIPGKPAGAIYVTTDRVIFVRDIDVWKEVKPLLTPLGLPAAAEKELNLKRLKEEGARQYCQVFQSQLQLTQVKRKSGFMRFRMVGEDGGKYELFVYTDKDDPAFFDLLDRTLRQKSSGP